MEDFVGSHEARTWNNLHVWYSSIVHNLSSDAFPSSRTKWGKQYWFNPVAAINLEIIKNKCSFWFSYSHWLNCVSIIVKIALTQWLKSIEYILRTVTTDAVQYSVKSNTLPLLQYIYKLLGKKINLLLLINLNRFVDWNTNRTCKWKRGID
jgi:hypothetical protein